MLASCAGDNHLDPSELELRDVLGIAPDTAMSWDADQRAAARKVLDAGMHETASAHAALVREPTLEHSIGSALAITDTARAKQQLGAMGIVELAIDHESMQATSRRSTLAPHDTSSIEIQLAGWEHWQELPDRGIDVLTTIATDAGHRGGPLLVTPEPQLAVIAAYVPGTQPRLVVNPVLLAALEPNPHPTTRPPLVLAIDTVGNPYTFYSSIASCTNAQRTRCEACLPKGNCTPIAGGVDGNLECTQLAANDGRGYSLECINLALAIDTVSACTEARAPSCPRDTHAASIDDNTDFFDRPECAAPLDQCLNNVFGTGPTSTTPSPTNNSSIGCGDSACDATPNCDDSGCDGTDDSSGDSCDSGEGGDSSCDSGDDSSSCDSGGDSGGDCSGGGGDDCASGGGDECSGGGGDCSGGGDDCNAAGRHKKTGGEYLWALLPLPFAIIARRRADRRRAKREVSL